MYTSLLERPPGGSRRVTRWVLMVTLGESVGFTVAAMVGVGVTSASLGAAGNLCRRGAGGIVGRSAAGHRPS
jgi:hypothetical protein